MEKEEFELLLKGVSEENGKATKAAIEAATKGLITSDQLAAKLEACGITEKSIKELNRKV